MRTKIFGVKQLGVLVCCLMSTGCIERSTVIKVKRDGSGIVHIRQHEQEISISLGVTSEKVDDDDEKKLPSEEALREMTSAMGDVELVSAMESVNRNGWKGYDLIFEFEDINDLVLLDEMLGPETGKEDEALAADGAAESTADDRDPEEGKKGGYRFEMADGILQVRAVLDEASHRPAESQQQIGAVDPFADAPPAADTSIDLKAVAVEQMMAAALSDMRIGIFIQVDGKLEATNAIFREGNLITLMRLNVGELLKDPNAKAHLSSMRHLKDVDRRQKLKELSVKVEGLDVDVQDPIMIEFE